MSSHRSRPSFGAPSRLVVLAFAAAIAVGTLLFALPAANADGAWHLDLRTLFLATSAACVTGLDPVGVGAALTPFGLAVLGILVELGGLGIMTIGTFLFLAAGRSLSVDEERSVMNTLGTTAPRQVGPILRQTVAFTLAWELAGALAMAARLQAAHPGYGAPLRALAHGVFLSVMSFCNAGFSLFPDSFAPFAADSGLTALSFLLSFAGGLGFVVHANLLSLRPWRRNRLLRGRLSLHSRLVLEGLAAGVALSLLVYLPLEARGAYAHLPAGSRVTAALFQAFSSRASGFACVPTASYGAATLLFTAALMFVGAAPGSTGGGVKTTTIAVFFSAVRAMFSRGTPELHGRSVPMRVIGDAVAITVLSALSVAVASFALLLAEADGPAPPGALVFEAVSAFANNGMEIGGTTEALSGPGLAIVSLAMFAGRLGPVALVLTLFRSRRTDVSKRFPEENIVVG